jgi:hypothetical protein
VYQRASSAPLAPRVVQEVAAEPTEVAVPEIEREAA